jgi:hypothetical protein
MPVDSVSGLFEGIATFGGTVVYLILSGVLLGMKPPGVAGHGD